MGYGGGTGGCDHCVIYSPYLQRIFPAAEYPQYYDFSYTASLSVGQLRAVSCWQLSQCPP